LMKEEPSALPQDWEDPVKNGSAEGCIGLGGPHRRGWQTVLGEENGRKFEMAFPRTTRDPKKTENKRKQTRSQKKTTRHPIRARELGRKGWKKEELPNWDPNRTGEGP